MPYSRPTLQAIINRLTDSLTSRLGGTASRRAVNQIVARVFAGNAHEEYGAIDFISKQIIPTTAEAGFLDDWAAVFKITRLAATFAQGPCDFTGTGTEFIPQDTVVLDGDGTQYKTVGDLTLVAGAGTVDVIAPESGTIGNLEEGEALTLEAPISGVDNDATVGTGGIVGGADQETDEDLRQRLLFVIRQPPHGGAVQDYVFWAQLVNGVGEVFVLPFNGGQVGNVDVSFLTDDPDNPIPDAPLIAEVQAIIDAERPVTVCSQTVFAFEAFPVNFVIELKPDSTDTAEVQANVIAELKALIARESSPAGNIYSSAAGTYVDGGTIPLSRINEAISQAQGEFDHVTTVPVADVTVDVGKIHSLGTVSFI